MKIASLASLALASIVAVAPLAACSSSNSGTDGTATPANQDKGLGGDGDTAAAGAPDKNPDGVAYPTANVYDAAALPWNANIDARTMEILSLGVGATTTEQGILDEVDGWLAQLK
jgi:hypothetical protein